jgi:hypothetical protein
MGHNSFLANVDPALALRQHKLASSGDFQRAQECSSRKSAYTTMSRHEAAFHESNCARRWRTSPCGTLRALASQKAGAVPASQPARVHAQGQYDVKQGTVRRSMLWRMKCYSACEASRRVRRALGRLIITRFRVSDFLSINTCVDDGGQYEKDDLDRSSALFCHIPWD